MCASALPEGSNVGLPLDLEGISALGNSLARLRCKFARPGEGHVANRPHSHLALTAGKLKHEDPGPGTGSGHVQVEISPVRMPTWLGDGRNRPSAQPVDVRHLSLAASLAAAPDCSEPARTTATSK